MIWGLYLILFLSPTNTTTEYLLQEHCFCLHKTKKLWYKVSVTWQVNNHYTGNYIQEIIIKEGLSLGLMILCVIRDKRGRPAPQGYQVHEIVYAEVLGSDSGYF